MRQKSPLPSKSATKYAVQHLIAPKHAALSLAVTGALAAGTLQAATITVTTLTDGQIPGQCSLRSALYSASTNSSFEACTSGDAGLDEIVFASGLNGVVQLQTGGIYGADTSSLPIGESVRIDGDERITVRGTGGASVFYAKYDGPGGSAFDADDVTFANITISNGGGEDFGGGIRSYSRSLRIENSTISNNFAALAGGGVFQRPNELNETNRLEVLQSTISDNFTYDDSGNGGGGVYASMVFGGTVQVASSTFFRNEAAGGHGGGLYVRNAEELTVKYSEFESNDAKYDIGRGGGVYARLNGATATFLDNELTFNSAESHGGGLFLREDFRAFGIGVQRGEFYLNGNRFDNNQSGDEGGGAYLQLRYGDQGTFEDPVKFIDISDDNQFHDNTAQNSGGGLRVVTYGTVVTTLSDTLFSTNTSIDGDGGALAITSSNDSVSITDARVYGNSAGFRGGGIDIDATDSSFTLSDSRVELNSSDGGCGGGLRVSSSPNEIRVSRSVISYNSAFGCGGGLALSAPALEDASVNIKYSTIANNSAGQGGGAGLFSHFGQNTLMRVTNATISGNDVTATSASANGGGLRFLGDMSVDLKYSTVANNASPNGAGVFSSAAECRILNTIFAGNSSGSGTFQELAGPSNCSVTSSLISESATSNFDNDGDNLLDIDPLLGGLNANGGPSYTHALLPGSPAIDAGVIVATVPTYDQRGQSFPRISGGALDMGAYEVLIDGVFSDRFQQTPP